MRLKKECSIANLYSSLFSYKMKNDLIYYRVLYQF